MDLWNNGPREHDIERVQGVLRNLELERQERQREEEQRARFEQARLAQEERLAERVANEDELLQRFERQFGAEIDRWHREHPDEEMQDPPWLRPQVRWPAQADRAGRADQLFNRAQAERDNQRRINEQFRMPQPMPHFQNIELGTGYVNQTQINTFGRQRRSRAPSPVNHPPVVSEGVPSPELPASLHPPDPEHLRFTRSTVMEGRHPDHPTTWVTPTPDYWYPDSPAPPPDPPE
jgi:hypothetical protein